jgi:hypothetical protein
MSLMNSAFLDDGDLERLTGYVRPSRQIEWLKANGIPFTVNARGRPAVRRDLAEMDVSEPELGPVP